MRKKYGSFISTRRRLSAVGARNGIAEAIGERRDREVGIAAPGREHQVDLVAAHQLLVGANAGLDLAAVVAADELDLPPAALDAESAGSVLLLGPEQVVRLLADLRATRPRPGAGDRVADTHRRALGANDAGQAERRRQGSDGTNEGAS
jgi:hypothetical protein